VAGLALKPPGGSGAVDGPLSSRIDEAGRAAAQLSRATAALEDACDSTVAEEAAFAEDELRRVATAAGRRAEQWTGWLRGAAAALSAPARATFARQWLLAARQCAAATASSASDAAAARDRAAISAVGIHLKAETAGRVSLRPLRHGSRQFERCHKAVAGKTGPGGRGWWLDAVWQLEHKPLLASFQKRVGADKSRVLGLFCHLPVSAAAGVAAFGVGPAPADPTHPASAAPMRMWAPTEDGAGDLPDPAAAAGSDAEPGAESDPRRVFSASPVATRACVSAAAAQLAGAPRGPRGPAPSQSLVDCAEGAAGWAAPALLSAAAAAPGSDSGPGLRARVAVEDAADRESGSARTASSLRLPVSAGRLGAFARSEAVRACRAAPLPLPFWAHSTPPAGPGPGNGACVIDAGELSSPAAAAATGERLCRKGGRRVLAVLCRVAVGQAGREGRPVAAAVPPGLGPSLSAAGADDDAGERAPVPSWVGAAAAAGAWSVPCSGPGGPSSSCRLVLDGRAVLPEFLMLLRRDDWRLEHGGPDSAAAAAVGDGTRRFSRVLGSAMDAEAAGREPGVRGAGAAADLLAGPELVVPPGAAAGCVQLSRPAGPSGGVADALSLVAGSSSSLQAPDEALGAAAAALRGAGVVQWAQESVSEAGAEPDGPWPRVPSADEASLGWAAACAEASRTRSSARAALAVCLRRARQGVVEAGCEAVERVVGRDAEASREGRGALQAAREQRRADARGRTEEAADARRPRGASTSRSLSEASTPRTTDASPRPVGGTARQRGDRSRQRRPAGPQPRPAALQGRASSFSGQPSGSVGRAVGVYGRGSSAKAEARRR